ncbi:MAG: class I SAM-dependent methyltransferase [Planctomycetes bacterium]|nr:class I SAM-dependent methyltransferase [Planctomycetota bacterium]
MPGTVANEEQLQMLHTRYAWATDQCIGKDVLEVGCGTGIGLQQLASVARSVVGGEYDPKLAVAAQQRYGSRIKVVEMDASSLPLADCSVDVVLLLESLYFLPQPEKFFLEARRVLRPDGKLLICSANRERSDFNPAPLSHRYFSAKELAGCLEKSGFSAEVFAGFPTENHGIANRLRQACRVVAIKLHLVPKSMAWKAVVKRLFFGRMEKLPSTLHCDPSRVRPLELVTTDDCVRGHKVIYAIGSLKVNQARKIA